MNLFVQSRSNVNDLSRFANEVDKWAPIYGSPQHSTWPTNDELVDRLPLYVDLLHITAAASSWERIALTGRCIYISTAPLSHQQCSKINTTYILSLSAAGWLCWLALPPIYQPNYQSINNQVGADDMNIASSSIQLVNMSSQPKKRPSPNLFQQPLKDFSIPSSKILLLLLDQPKSIQLV